MNVPRSSWEKRMMLMGLIACTKKGKCISTFREQIWLAVVSKERRFCGYNICSFLTLLHGKGSWNQDLNLPLSALLLSFCPYLAPWPWPHLGPATLQHQPASAALPTFRGLGPLPFWAAMPLFPGEVRPTSRLVDGCSEVSMVWPLPWLQVMLPAA